MQGWSHFILDNAPIHTSRKLPMVVFIWFFMVRNKFSTGDRSGLQAGQSSTHTLCLWSHADMQKEAWHCLVEANRDLLGKDVDGSKCLSKIPIYASVVPSKICKSPIPWAPMHLHERCWPLHLLLISLDGPFHLWHGGTQCLDVPFFNKTNWNVGSPDYSTHFHSFSLLDHPRWSQENWCMAFFLRNSFKLHFLMQGWTVLSDSGLLLSSCGYI